MAHNLLPHSLSPPHTRTPSLLSLKHSDHHACNHHSYLTLSRMHSWLLSLKLSHIHVCNLISYSHLCALIPYPSMYSYLTHPRLPHPQILSSSPSLSFLAPTLSPSPPHVAAVLLTLSSSHNSCKTCAMAPLKTKTDKTPKDIQDLHMALLLLSTHGEGGRCSKCLNM